MKNKKEKPCRTHFSITFPIAFFLVCQKQELIAQLFLISCANIDSNENFSLFFISSKKMARFVKENNRNEILT